jgi:hypothetical protein
VKATLLPHVVALPGLCVACGVFQEPAAFLGGVFAGFLSLSLSEDPLRGWIQRTAADVQVGARIGGGVWA